MSTIGELLRLGTLELTAAGIDTARLDARLLLSHVTGLSATRLITHPEAAVSLPHIAAYVDAVHRRASRRPISHIIGQRGFWTLSLSVTPDTLDPRPDTETLVQLVLDHIPDRQAPLRLVDFGTGTGAILLALLSELPNAQGLAVDISPAALDVARRNAAAHGLADRTRFHMGDWGEGLEETFDIAVSNPPYIPAARMAELEPEVRNFEPRLALVGGTSGLECYYRLLPHLARLLTPGGFAAVEHGEHQSPAITALFAQHGFEQIGTRQDLASIERCVYGFLPQQ